jgi:hypothetical protein
VTSIPGKKPHFVPVINFLLICTFATNYRRFWCKLWGLRDDGTMPRFVPAEELFKGRHFDRKSWFCVFAGTSVSN